MGAVVPPSQDCCTGPAVGAVVPSSSISALSPGGGAPARTGWSPFGGGCCREVPFFDFLDGGGQLGRGGGRAGGGGRARSGSRPTIESFRPAPISGEAEKIVFWTYS